MKNEDSQAHNERVLRKCLSLTFAIAVAAVTWMGASDAHAGGGQWGGPKMSTQQRELPRGAVSFGGPLYIVTPGPT